jgi:dTDP-4-dehydrorhamnose reductase
MKILLLGKDGQVGRELQRSLLPLGELTAVGRSQADLEDVDGLMRLLSNAAPDVIVNAAAYTAVDKAETDRERARAVNGTAVDAMARYGADAGALLVHYSTDYVFDGEKPGPYTETDAANPQSVYGVTKYAGEQAIQRHGGKAFVFRTSWVFSAHGANFVKTIMRLAQQNDSLRVVNDQLGAPTSAELIADVTTLALAAVKSGALPFGTYHLSAGGQTTWYDFAKYIVGGLQVRTMALRLTADHISPTDSANYPQPATRPKNSVLDTRKLRNALGLEIPDWSVYVDRTLDRLG